MFNSRHPGPRRVWKGGPEQQFLTPLWRAPLHPVDPLANSPKHVSEQRSITFGYFGDPKTGQKLAFEQHSITLGYKYMFWSNAPTLFAAWPGHPWNHGIHGIHGIHGTMDSMDPMDSMESTEFKDSWDLRIP